MSKRIKRELAGHEVKSFTLHMRADVHDKLEALIGPGGSKVSTIEKMTEYIFARRLRKIANTMKDNSCNSGN